MENVSYRPLPIDQSNVRSEHGPDSERGRGIATGETAELTLPLSAVYRPTGHEQPVT